jgi:hypothetical protein
MMKDDDRSRLTDADRLTLSRPRELGQYLDEERYPPDVYPTLNSEPDLWLRAVEELRIDDVEGEGDPVELHDLLTEFLQANGGTVPLTVTDGGDEWIAGGPERGLKMSIEISAGTNIDGLRHMDAERLSEAELAEELSEAADAEKLYESLAELTAVDEDINAREGVVELCDQADVSIASAVRHALETGAADPEAIRRVLNDVG